MEYYVSTMFASNQNINSSVCVLSAIYRTHLSTESFGNWQGAYVLITNP